MRKTDQESGKCTEAHVLKLSQTRAPELGDLLHTYHKHSVLVAQTLQLQQKHYFYIAILLQKLQIVLTESK